MPSYKLRYFDVRGRAEVIRWMFAHSTVDYEDNRIKSEEWKEMKNNVQDFPFKQMPVLEVVNDDGTKTVVAQSQTILRFVAAELGLSGKTKFDVARCDMLNEHVMSALMTLPWEQEDKEEKARLMLEAVTGPVTEHLKLLETFVQDSGHLVGSDFTSADINFSAACEFLTPTCPALLDCVPKLKRLDEKVRNSSGIAKWIAERPVTHI